MKNTWFSVQEALTVTTEKELKSFVEIVFDKYNKVFKNFDAYCNEWWHLNITNKEGGGNILGIAEDHYFDGMAYEVDFSGVILPYLEFQDMFFLSMKEIAVGANKTSKPRYHRKRKPVPTRKKTDVKVFYSGVGFGNDYYTIKNVSKIQKTAIYLEVFSDSKTFDGGQKSEVTKFLVDDIVELQVKTPSGNIDFMRQSKVVWEYSEELPNAFHVEDRRNNLLSTAISADFIYNF